MRAQAPAPGRPIPLRAPPSLTDTMHTLESPLDPHFIGYAGKNQKKALVGGTSECLRTASKHLGILLITPLPAPGSPNLHRLLAAQVAPRSSLQC
jgi:hypothetical protein